MNHWLPCEILKLIIGFHHFFWGLLYSVYMVADSYIFGVISCAKLTKDHTIRFVGCQSSSFTSCLTDQRVSRKLTGTPVGFPEIRQHPDKASICIRTRTYITKTCASLSAWCSQHEYRVVHIPAQILIPIYLHPISILIRTCAHMCKNHPGVKYQNWTMNDLLNMGNIQTTH